MPKRLQVDATSRARGCMLGLLIGDALGAAVEGFDPDEIKNIAVQNGWNDGYIHDYIEAVHMATYIKIGDEFHNVVFESERRVDGRRYEYLGHGPISGHSDVRAPCARLGMYTDDGNSSLALASSLVENSSLNPEHAAKRYAEFWQTGSSIRGYPESAKNVMAHVLDGSVHYTESGLEPVFPFKGGSWANGGAMRISPIAIAYRNAASSVLRKAVTWAIYSSHRHPEAVDGAFVQARMVQYALNSTSVHNFKNGLRKVICEIVKDCLTDAMKGVVTAVYDSVIKKNKTKMLQENPSPDREALNALLLSYERRGSGMGFQIAAVHAIPCVLWIALKYHTSAEWGVMKAISLGGDTDTIASMVGAILGALHGEHVWKAPENKNWFDALENDDRGRDYALELGTRLAELDLTSDSSVLVEENL
uniref:ADP-ribosylhydrolase ARH3 n=2 Tax=Sar TaxID=2698737 RepID=A0A7S3PRY3_9STRA|mmetsp:Transcript_12468/g.15478  ORF Transcript_12468/g.15478 Transcript_12468/m.15478 type:complete len:420 (+) Transcript_12468:172-1431(+)|eukprot:CAMPEP_0204823228 /NCGR_PEP_ID=MMETSP1346-20131115/1306_1 /ASSEMBLY_ACC=CAM_ASM_000771 /TAXON_ID=215587 /ORGANISM="Aplanochytrium stocchinoi, Strain GSBS06" /LENGTH=419 /DNA_ID=CAMNT_0051949785 /DNA_START=258 /DNA_END=1517 /DNA_ORIENTATION=+